MDKGRQKTIYVCQQCGRESSRWFGKCPGCDQWNTLIQSNATSGKQHPRGKSTSNNLPLELSAIADESSNRIILPFKELNRVLGGGLVPGSVVLIGGDPGIGKSTLLLQISGCLAGESGKILYVSGEESLQQLKLRANRVGIKGEGLFLLAETDLDSIISAIEDLSPVISIIDSIQTISQPGIAGVPGSLSQVRECTFRLAENAKKSGRPVIVAGHVTKDGAIAGPKTLEHMVDVVLYMEGEPFSAYRILRGDKNRYGSTNEIGIFEMRSQGLVEVDNPSLVFLSQRATHTVGSIVIPTLEGTRPLLVEIQALTNPTLFGMPRRTANGIDFNRLLLISAVLTRRASIPLSNQDILVNVTGGLKVNEPAADLGIALAIASSMRNRELDPGLVAIGEIGLTGELRGVPQMERRLGEAARLGFKRCLLPKAGLTGPVPGGIEIIAAETVREAFRHALPEAKTNKTRSDDSE